MHKSIQTHIQTFMLKVYRYQKYADIQIPIELYR